MASKNSIEKIYKALEILDGHFDVVRNVYEFSGGDDIKEIHYLLDEYVREKKKEPTLRIDCFGDHTVVYENGVPIEKVKSISFTAGVDCFPELELTKVVV